MTRNMRKAAAADRIFKLAAAARAIQRMKNAGCCGRKPSSKRRRRGIKRSSLNKEASRDYMRKMACAIAVIQRARSMQKTAKDEGSSPFYTNPIALSGAGGAILGGTLGAVLGPKGQKFLSGLLGAGLGLGVGVGGGYGWNKFIGKGKKQQASQSGGNQAGEEASYPFNSLENWNKVMTLPRIPDDKVEEVNSELSKLPDSIKLTDDPVPVDPGAALEVMSSEL